MENTVENAYNLSIRISSDGFSLFVNDKYGLQISSKTLTVPMFSLPAEELVKLLSIETQLNYQNIRIVCESDIYLFVPEPVFKPEEASVFLNFQHNLQKSDSVIYNTIPTWNTVNVFAIPSTLHQAIAELFPKLKIEHQMSYLLTDKIKFQQENSLHVWSRPRMQDIVILKEGRLQLMNSYSYQTSEDFCYHTLNVIEQLSVDTEKCNVYLYNTEQKPELAKLLNNYVTVIS